MVSTIKKSTSCLDKLFNVYTFHRNIESTFSFIRVNKLANVGYTLGGVHKYRCSDKDGVHIGDFNKKSASYEVVSTIKVHQLSCQTFQCSIVTHNPTFSLIAVTELTRYTEDGVHQLSCQTFSMFHCNTESTFSFIAVTDLTYAKDGVHQLSCQTSQCLYFPLKLIFITVTKLDR
ncbi:hypothetical protein CEXT_653351 [Caerostris extrusa]|uniref:ZP domain-containing protein n=1 Tax=Caerostris extrusa TaxID=172846 RepID=A0AAV4PFE3_CAEEX|nr:hypothetical protein CEXT_653351 [Caerostris extrusa]